MPNYEYHCKACEHKFDVMVSMSRMDAPTSEACPVCHEFRVERLFPSSAPTLGDPVRLGIRRPDEGFKDVLRRIDRSVPGSVIRNNSRYI